MSIENLGSIGEFVGAIATVATLIYLAVQVRSNTKLTQAAAIQYMLDGARDRISMRGYVTPDVAEIMARGLSNYEALTNRERVRFTWFLVEHALQLQNVLNLHQQGLLSEMDYQTWVNYVSSFIRTPGGKIIWPQLDKTISPDVRESINAHLASNPDQPSLIELMPVFDARRWQDDPV